MIWSNSRPVHVSRTSAKEAFFDIVSHSGEDNPDYLGARTAKKWKHFFTPAELRVYRDLCYAYRHGQDRVVSNLNSGVSYIVTFVRVVD